MTDFAAVLVRPARPANVGAAARALKNFGFSDLRLVGEDVLGENDDAREARAVAWNASELLEAASRFASLEEAVEDLSLVAAATARADTGGETISPRELGEELARLPGGARGGCVFGPEVHGLSNLELDCCRVRLRIPTRGEQPSMNLAQSLVVVAYEASLALRPAAGEDSERPIATRPPPATEGEMQRVTDAARELLLRAGYLNPQAPDHVLGELRRLVGRARPTSREVTLLLGLIAQLDWARENLD